LNKATVINKSFIFGDSDHNYWFGWGVSYIIRVNISIVEQSLNNRYQSVHITVYHMAERTTRKKAINQGIFGVSSQQYPLTVLMAKKNLHSWQQHGSITKLTTTKNTKVREQNFVMIF
jgi:hypothetical protein